MIHTRYLCKVYNDLSTIVLCTDFHLSIQALSWSFKWLCFQFSDLFNTAGMFIHAYTLWWKTCWKCKFDMALIRGINVYLKMLTSNFSKKWKCCTTFFLQVSTFNELLWLLFKMLVVVWYAYVLNIPGNLVKFSSVITPYFLSFSIKVRNKYMYIKM